MTATITGRLTGSKTIQLDSPLITDETEILIKLKKSYTRKKIIVPESYVLEIADTDIEELY
jgi:hypothetical protein